MSLYQRKFSVLTGGLGDCHIKVISFARERKTNVQSDLACNLDIFEEDTL